MKNKLFYFLLFVLITAFGLHDNPSGGWYQQYLPNIGNASVKDILFTDSLNGYSISNINSSNQSFILKSTNGGDNWIINLTFNPGRILQTIKFIDQQTGYINAGYNELYKTTDGGGNWQTLILPTDLYSNDMSVLNEDTIFLVDDESLTGGLFRTTNGGVNWQQLYYNFGGNPDKIYMYDGNLGFMGVYPDRLFRTSNGGINWTLISGERDFSEMDFIDSLTGWKCDGNMYKTTNGGINWIEQALPEKRGIILTTSMRSISVLNSDTIWGTGGIAFFGPGRQRGMIYKTTNGGINWGYQIPDTSIDISQYYFIQFIDSKKGWSYSPSSTKGGVHTVVGGNDTTIYTSIKLVNSEVPNDFRLHQNYPNPFNPKTIINYELRISSYVKLNVYDIQGKELMLLAEQRHNPGSYKVEFDGSGLSSGVYFYRLEVIDERTNKIFSDTKKMIFAK